MFAGVFASRKVLVTGHTGFKGSWLCLWLQQLGADVVGVSNTVLPEPSHYTQLRLTPGWRVKDLFIDIRDAGALQQLIQNEAPELVIHMAAQPLVRLSYHEPLETLSTNIMGTANLLQACRRVPNLRGIINITSDKCYENIGKREGYTESDPMGGHDPYSASKGCAELVAASYARAFPDLAPMASVRAGNVIGGGDWASDRLVPDIARACQSGEELIIRRPDAVRPWQHVLEPLSGYLSIAQKLLQGETEAVGGWNFGPNEESTLSVGDVVARLQTQMGFKYRIEQSAANLHEASMLTLSSQKAHQKLGWHPVWNAEQMLAHTAQWYSAFLTNKSLHSQQQLADYIAHAKAQGLPWAN